MNNIHIFSIKKMFLLFLSIGMVIIMLVVNSVNVFAATGTTPQNATVNVETALPAPIYTVTIPTVIDFGDCEKAMANDSEENRIKTIENLNLSVNHSNLFINGKTLEVTINSDFTIKNGEESLVFTLYDGVTKISDGITIFTVNPTEFDRNITQPKTIIASFDKTQIKKAQAYTGTVTFTVTLADAE